VSFGSLWIAAGDKVLRVRGDSPEVIARIAMPQGMSAGALAADAETGSLWVGDCGCPIE
jgi:ligand-binding sensor domain-containing protein